MPRSDDDAELARQVAEYRELARRESGREIQVWTSGYMALADSIADAEKYIDYYAIENGDEPHVDAFIAESITRSRVVSPEALIRLKRSLKAGTGGIPLLGEARDIAERLARASRCGIDGVLLVWMDYQNGVRQFNAHVLPLLEAMELRGPRPAAP